MKYFIEGIEVESVNFDFADETDAQKYIDYVKERVAEPLKSIKVINCDDGKVDVDYILQGEKFERIRRITGKRIAVCSQAG